VAGIVFYLVVLWRGITNPSKIFQKTARKLSTSCSNMSMVNDFGHLIPINMQAGLRFVKVAVLRTVDREARRTWLMKLMLLPLLGQLLWPEIL
jgi:hypothetical protein